MDVQLASHRLAVLSVVLVFVGAYAALLGSLGSPNLEFGGYLVNEDETRSGFRIEANVTSILSADDFEASYMGSDDGAQGGDRVTVLRGQNHVCTGEIVSVTPDSAIVRTTGGVLRRTVKVGDRVVAHVNLPKSSEPLHPDTNLRINDSDLLERLLQ